MLTHRALRSGIAVLLLGISLGACGREREAALAEVGKIEQACQRGKPDEARELMVKAAENNREFGRALADAAGGSDRSRINACGLVLTRLKRNLKRH
jgi:hypothetical protein